MMEKYNKLKSMAILILAMLIFTSGIGQEKQNIEKKRLAENIFTTYHKFVLQTGISSLYVENEFNAISFAYEKPRTFEIGFTYNFYQYKKFNFFSNLT